MSRDDIARRARNGGNDACTDGLGLQRCIDVYDVQCLFVFVCGLGQPSAIGIILGTLCETASNVFGGGTVYGDVGVAVSAEDGRHAFGHEVNAEANDGVDVGLLAHLNGVVSHFERVGNGHQWKGGDAVAGRIVGLLE
eukprot:scaffold2131_cov192-Alexandrium_tamarense.AAC.3